MSDRTKISAPQPNAPEAEAGGFYAPSAQTPGAASRTFVPGMKRRPEAAAFAEEEPERRAAAVKVQDRKIAGFLFTRSADDRGELYPVYLGRNTIGADPQCDIYLAEATVSPAHAVILVRALPGGRPIQVCIADYNSGFGTSVNGQRIGGDRTPLEDGDLIAVGRGYALRYHALTADTDIAPSPAFQAVERQDNDPREQIYARLFAGRLDEAAAQDEDIYPTSVGEAEENVFYGRTRKREDDHVGAVTLDNPAGAAPRK